jgi:hypothetical protein
MSPDFSADADRIARTTKSRCPPLYDAIRLKAARLRPLVPKSALARLVRGFLISQNINIFTFRRHT